MPELRQFLIICPFVFLAGLIDSVAGGGGLISLPAYLAAGVPPHMTLGTNKFSCVFGTALSSARYFKHGKADIKTAATSIIFALAGSALGARTVLYLDPVFLKYALLAVIPVIAFIVLKKKDLGAENKIKDVPAARIHVLSAAIGLSVGFYDGFFGPGTGTFLVLLYTGLLRYDLVTATGNAKFVNLASNAAAVTMFLINREVNFALGIPAMLCGVAGNYVGSGMAIKKGARIIRPMFIIALTLLIIYIVRDLFIS